MRAIDVREAVMALETMTNQPYNLAANSPGNSGTFYELYEGGGPGGRTMLTAHGASAMVSKVRAYYKGWYDSRTHAANVPGR